MGHESYILVQLNNTLKKLEAQAKENEQLIAALEQRRLASQQGKEDSVSLLLL